MADTNTNTQPSNTKVAQATPVQVVQPVQTTAATPSGAVSTNPVVPTTPPSFEEVHGNASKDVMAAAASQTPSYSQEIDEKDAKPFEQEYNFTGEGVIVTASSMEDALNQLKEKQKDNK
jgi:hypothetical protein